MQPSVFEFDATAPWATGMESQVAPQATLVDRIVALAGQELAAWDNGNLKETSAGARPMLLRYWAAVGTTGSAAEGAISGRTAWSAAFVSWVMREAGCGDAFEYSSAHRIYAGAAKRARAAGDAAKYRAFRLDEATPALGDVIVRDRAWPSGGCAGTTYDNVDDGTAWPTHGDIVVAVKAGSLSVVGGNVSESVSARAVRTDPSGHIIADQSDCRVFALLKAPGTPVGPGQGAPPPRPTAPGGSLASLPARIAEFVRGGALTLQLALAIVGGERDEATLANEIFWARHPELNRRAIRKGETQLANEWLRIRDSIVRPALAAMAGAPLPHASPPQSTGRNETIEQFTQRLGAEWSQARATAGLSAVAPAEMARWLGQDYRETVEGARLRWEKPNRRAPDVTAAWMTGREHQMRFQTAPSSRLPGLANFNPPATRATLISSPLVDSSDVAPVAPATVRFVEELRKRTTGFRVSNYRGHGGGSFKDRGHSLDIFLGEKDARGFYTPASAFAFMRALDAAATASNQRWRVIYNDFDVADPVNRSFGSRRMIFVGSSRKDGNKVVGLNWHGPEPLILHLHLDLAPR